MSPSAQSAFSEKLKQLLAERGLTQTEVATRTHIDRVDLNRMVNDKREPKPHEVAVLAVVLKVDPKELAGDVDLEQIKLFIIIAEHLVEAEDRLSERQVELQSLADSHRAAESRWTIERQELIAEREQSRRDAAARIAELETTAARREAALDLRLREQANQLAQRAETIAQLQNAIAANTQTITTLRAEVAGAGGRAIFSAVIGALAGAALAKSGDND